MENDPNDSTRRSPVKKKSKVAKPHKVYFFQPQNTLAYNPRAASPPKEDAAHTKRALDISNQHIQQNVQNNLDQTPKNTLDSTSKNPPNPDLNNLTFLSSSQELIDTRKPVDSVKIYDRSMDQQSSDDSFEGVRWKASTTPRKPMKPILSSPLKLSDVQSREKLASTVANELTDSMLSKYGMGLPETHSQTPRYSRTVSDGAQLLSSTSPTLARSKSFDSRPKSNVQEHQENVGSRLNTWISKFAHDAPGSSHNLESESNSASSNSVSSASVSSKLVPLDIANEAKKTPSTSSISVLENSILQDNVESEDELFSDEDSFLASLPLNSLSSMKKPSEPPEPSKVSETKVMAEDQDTSEIDPFSDDLDLEALGGHATQTPSIEPSYSVQPAPTEVEKETPSVSKHGARISYTNPDFRRYQIKSIFETTFNVKNFKRKQLVLSVVDQDDADTKLIVRGEAAGLSLRIDDIVHIIHTSSENNRLVDDSHNLLIWNPDTLVSSTTVADQLYCPRKTVLSSRIQSRGEHSIPCLGGSIVHEIFQSCFVSGKFSMDYLTKVMNSEIERNLLDIYSMGDVLGELREKLQEELPNIAKWFQTFYKKAPKEIPTNMRQQKIRFSVAETLDIEESVWSPMFGIKGMVDVTLKANLEGESSHGQFLLPMELKTGQPSLSHEAQSALYSLLFKDRYNVDITSFLLVYTMKQESTKKHDISVSDLKSLVNLRNRISRFFQPGNQELPDLLRESKCDRCYVQEPCMTMNFLLENGDEEHSGLIDGAYDNIISHLKAKRPEYSKFLHYWDSLLTKEEEFISRFGLDLWILTSKTREEQQGKALSSLVIVDQMDVEKDNGEYTYVFRRGGTGEFSAMNKTQITKFDRVIISDESGHFALARGTVRHIDSECIVIGSRRRIIPTESKTDRFHRAGVLHTSQANPNDIKNRISFRIDKDDMFYGMGTARWNILKMFLPEGDHKRRELVVDSRAPKFSDTPFFDISDEVGQLNSNQVNVLRKVSLCKDYSLILGMPGTGKTTVIVHLIKALVKSKKSVLLASYTNSAVDNILIKLMDHDIDFIRIGHPARVHERVQDYIPGSAKKSIESYSDYQNVYGNPYVVASTCLGVSDVSFNLRNHFDYCIVDEASQVSMALSLGPLAICDRFVLVGDHFQLPPLVTNPDPKVRAGLSQSLFQMLATAHPKSVVQLQKQYRMCQKIMLISNELVYQGRLECGSDQVANQTLSIPHIEALNSHVVRPNNRAWLAHALQEDNQVVFFNHDAIPGHERMVAENITNPTEVELIRQTVEGLCACGVDPSQIGVMTIYRAQLKLLSASLKHHPQVEILTADRFQGRDKDCIIISLVRSNEERTSGQLLKDWRRVNVAVTRARAKLIVFGGESTLSQADSIKKFVSLAQKEDWIYDLPKDCLSTYEFKINTQSSPIRNRPKVRISLDTARKHAIVSDILADMEH